MNGKRREEQPHNVQAEDSRLEQCSQFGFMIDSEWTFDGITERAITAAMLSNGFELAVAFRKVDGRNCNDEDNS